MELMDMLRERGWRPGFPSDVPVKHYLRINSAMGSTQPWIFARLDCLDAGWWVTISWRVSGRSHLLLTLMGTELEPMLEQAEEAINGYEASMRLGWKP